MGSLIVAATRERAQVISDFWSARRMASLTPLRAKYGHRAAR